MRMARVRMSGAVAIAMILLATGWQTLTKDLSVLTMNAAGIVLVVGVGCALRMIPRFPDGVAWIVQTLTAVGLLAALVREPLQAGELQGFLTSGIQALNEGAAPLDPHPAIRVLFIAVSLAFVLTAEAIVEVAETPGWSIAPILGWYGVYAFVPRPQASVLTFVAAAAGYLLILLADSVNRSSAWRANISRDTGTGNDATYTAARLGATIGIPIVAAAVILGTMLPTLTPRDLTSNGGGTTLTDPRLDLRRNLHANTEREVLTYRTSGPGGVHLRLAALSRLDADGWSAPPAPAINAGSSPFALPPAAGLTQPATGTRSTTVRTGTFPGTYLPLPYAPAEVTADGRWTFDPFTLTVYSTGNSNNNATNHITYTVRSNDIQPTRAQLQNTRAGMVIDGSNATPPGFPEGVRQLTQQVTRNARTPIEQAAAIENFLRSPAFTYDLNVAPDTTGFSSLEEFLLRSRRGYCEQFAGSMAAMARVVGIPSRVAIGFLPGRQTGPGQYSVTNLQMHAWPELYFDGWGWLRFEPTPGSVSGEPPPYVGDTQPGAIEDTPTPTPSETPTPTPSETPTTSATPTPTVAPNTTSSGPSSGIAIALGVIGGALVVALLALVPMLLRRARTSRRLSVEGSPAQRVGAAWAEVRDTMIDVGRPWEPLSPRALADRIAAAAPSVSRARIDALALAVERSRFAPGVGTVPDDLAGIVTAIRESAFGGLSRAARVRARLWPRSLFTVRPRRSARSVSPA